MRYGYNGDPKFEPLSPWAYFGLSLLYSIPVIGFIFLIIFSIEADNINVRSYSRSFFCSLLVGVILICVLIAIIGGIFGFAGIMAAINK